MHWFRSNSRLSSWLALFALALQLVLSFGHVHLAASRSLSAKQIAAVDHGAPAPASSDIPLDADEGCALCAVIHLASNLVLAAPPPLAPPPLTCAPACSRPADHVHLRGTRLALFRARGPPIA